MLIKRFIIAVIIVAIVMGGFFYFRYQIYFSHGDNEKTQIFKIEKGEGNKIIGENLAEEKFIDRKSVV